jgi:hypothetical protein
MITTKEEVHAVVLKILVSIIEDLGEVLEEYCVGIRNFIKPLLVIRVVLWVHDCSPQEEQITGSDILIIVLEKFEKFK